MSIFIFSLLFLGGSSTEIVLAIMLIIYLLVTIPAGFKIYNNLQTGGVFCGGVYSVDNIAEIKESSIMADLDVYNKACMRCIPNVDIKTLGSTLNAVGFKNVSCNIIEVKKQFIN